MHLLGAHILKPCTRQPKHARRVQGAPLIANTDLDFDNSFLIWSSNTMHHATFA